MRTNEIPEHCFSPLSDAHAQLLILGSYPGITSLEKKEYYAHPRNVFWNIMSLILGFDRFSGYETKGDAMRQAGVALWDVLYSCKRKGSLDSSIESPSIIINDFNTFFFNHREIRTIIFNGVKAEQEFKKRVLPVAAGLHESIEMIRLPSTSPAMASMTYAQKFECWKMVANYVHSS